MQRKHDENFHRDIFYLSPQERLEHTAFHFGQYSARIARAVKAIQAGRSSEYNQLPKTLTDSFLMILSAGELFNLDLEASLRKRLKFGGKTGKLKDLVAETRTKESRHHPWLETRSNEEQLIGLLLDISDISGVLHKACDSLDHIEGLNREEVSNAILDLLVILLLAADLRKVNLAKTAIARWKEIERVRIL